MKAYYKNQNFEGRYTICKCCGEEIMHPFGIVGVVGDFGSECIKKVANSNYTKIIQVEAKIEEYKSRKPFTFFPLDDQKKSIESNNQKIIRLKDKLENLKLNII